MKINIFKHGLPFIIASLLYSSSVICAEPDLQRRLQRLEKLLNNQVLLEQDRQIKQLRQEASALHEKLEKQAFQLKDVKKKQANSEKLFKQIADKTPAQSNGETPGSKPIIKRRKAPWVVVTEEDSLKPKTNNTPATAKPQKISSSVTTHKPEATKNHAHTSGNPDKLGKSVKPEKPHDRDGKKTYSSIFKKLKKGHYPQAITDYKAFIIKYPESRLIASAHYWLGEAYFLQNNFAEALNIYKHSLTKYALSNKAQAMELKVAYCYYELGYWSKARMALKRIIAKHRGNTIAEKAKAHLKKIKKEGH